MKKMKIKIKLSEFNPRKTFLCGQCFRWSEDENGDFSGNDHFVEEMFDRVDGKSTERLLELIF